MAGTNLWVDFPAYFGIYQELNPVDLPVTSLLMQRGVTILPSKKYTYVTHSNPDMNNVTLTLANELATINFGSTGFTQGSNVMQAWFEGAAESWFRMGDQDLGATAGWRGPQNASFEDQTLARGMVEALLSIKTQLEYVAREGTYLNSGSTLQQRGYRRAPGITNKLADGAVAGSGTLGTFGTLTRTVLLDSLQSLYENKVNGNNRLTLFTRATGKRAISEIMRNDFNSGKNGLSIVEAGINITRFVSDFGDVDVVLTNTFPANDIYLLNLGAMRVVGHAVPGKGVMFEADGNMVGVAGVAKGIYTEMGVDHGSGSCHARIAGVGSTVKGGVAVSAT